MGFGSFISKATSAVSDAFSTASDWARNNSDLLSFGGNLIGAGASYLGGVQQANAQEQANRENIAYQKEFAQNGIRWKVADAIAAGIHPLAALGANTVSFSPSSVGSSAGSALSSLGQNISGAIDRTLTRQERQEALEYERKRQQTQDSLSAEMQAAQIRLINAQTSSILSRRVGNPVATQPRNPPFPDPNDPFYENPVNSPDTAKRPDVIPSSYQYVRDADGNVEIVPSQSFSNSVDSLGLAGIPLQLKWIGKNYIRYHAGHAGRYARRLWDSFKSSPGSSTVYRR